MLGNSEAFSGFTVDNLVEAEHFYGEVLGLKVARDAMGLRLTINNHTPLFIYEKSNHVPAEYTILNFPLDSIDTAVEWLKEHGVVFEKYDNLPADQDEQHILRGKSVNQGPDIAWFKDPAGNILSVLEK